MTFAAWSGKCVGLFDRAGIPPGKVWGPVGASNAWGQAAANTILSGFVMKGNVGGGVSWNEMMPTGAGNSIYQGTSGLNPIDKAFQQCDDYNAHNASLPLNQQGPFWTLKFRVLCGEFAPTWAKILGGGAGWPGNLGIPGDSIPGPVQYVGAWWETGAGSYGEAWKNFMTLLGQYIPSYNIANTTSSGGLNAGANTHVLDGHPLLGEVTEAASMTKYAEPLMKDDYKTNNSGGSGDGLRNIRSIGGAGAYTLAKDVAAHKVYMNHMVTAFPNTCWSFSYNPMLDLSGSGAVGKSQSSTNLLIDYQAISTGSTWPRVVLENNSLLDSFQSGDTAVWPGHTGSGWLPGPPSNYNDPKGLTATYTQMAGYTNLGGALGSAFTDIPTNSPNQPPNMPICFQTNAAGAPKNDILNAQDLEQTIKYAIWLGARMVELPAGYDSFTGGLAIYANYYSQLVANDPSVGVASLTVTGISPNTGPAAGGTVVTITGTGFVVGGTTVAFGANAGTSVSFSSSTSGLATSPAGTGTVDITVTAGGQTSAMGSNDLFGYVVPPPPLLGSARQHSFHPGKSPGFAPMSARFYVPTQAFQTTHQTFHALTFNVFLDFSGDPGNLPRKVTRAFAVFLNFTTTFSKQRSMALSGVLNFTTTSVKLTGKGINVGLGFLSSLPRVISRGLSGAAMFTTVFVARRTLYLQALAGVLNFTTTTSKQAGRNLLGSLGFFTSYSKVRFIRKMGATVPVINVIANDAVVTPAWALDMPRFSGDLLIARVFYVGGTGTIAVVGPNWQPVSNGDVISGTVHTQIFWKIATGSDPAPTFTAATAALMGASLEEFINNDPNTPLQLNAVGSATSTSGSTLTATEGAFPTRPGGVSVTSSAIRTVSSVQTETPGSGWTTSGWYGIVDTGHGGGDTHYNPSLIILDSELVTVDTTTLNWALQIAFFNSGFGPTFLQTLAASLNFTTTSSKKMFRGLSAALNLTTFLDVTTTVHLVFVRAFTASLGFVVTASQLKGLKTIFFNATMTAHGSIPYMIRWYTGAFKISSEGILRAANRIRTIITQNRNK